MCHPRRSSNFDYQCTIVVVVVVITF